MFACTVVILLIKVPCSKMQKGTKIENKDLLAARSFYVAKNRTKPFIPVPYFVLCIKTNSVVYVQNQLFFPTVKGLQCRGIQTDSNTR